MRKNLLHASQNSVDAAQLIATKRLNSVTKNSECLTLSPSNMLPRSGCAWLAKNCRHARPDFHSPPQVQEAEYVISAQNNSQTHAAMRFPTVASRSV
jgi:hypothetical protein